MKMVVVVDQEHIRQGSKNPIDFGKRDYITLAVKKALRIDNLQVGISQITIFQPSGQPTYIVLPQDARVEMEKFDRTKVARPFTFEIEVPD